MPKPTKSAPQFPWSCPTCGATHLYDCPNIGPVQFLTAVMHDHTVPMRQRMRAADHLLKLKARGITSDPIEPEYDVRARIIIPPHPSLQ